MIYHKDPRVTSDRSPPPWFLDRLKEIDPCLHVEWWNEHPYQGPSFRLIRRVGPHYASIQWFKYEDEMHALIKWLKVSDTHKSNVSQRRFYAELLAEANAENEARLKAMDEKHEAIGMEVGENILRGVKDTMYSIPGVSARRDWNVG
jgi:aromatic ring-cleaving dioxygenase